MVTLRQLYTVFGHDERWRKFATACTQPMVAVYLRKLGDTDITLLTEFDIELQEAMCQQPEERKVKARSCMHHLLNWAKEQGKKVITIAAPGVAKTEEKPKEKPKIATDKPKKKKDDRTDKRPKVADVDTDNDGQRRVSPTTKPVKATTRKAKPADKKRVEPKPKRLKPEKVITKHPTKEGDVQQKRPTGETQMTMEEWQADTRYRHGTIEHDTSSKGWKNGKRVFKDCWRAVIMVNGQRYRHRAETREECREWLKAVNAKKILPTDNKADWWRMEQHKDEEARIDELIVSAAEEANIVYEYRQTGDTQILYDYCVKALLPHMVWYCAHTLHLGKDRSLTCSRQAVGLILTKIVGGRPVTNITFTCKRMLRTYKNRGDFWYYDKAPEAVRLMVNRIDMTALAELYKVTKDRRI